MQTQQLQTELAGLLETEVDCSERLLAALKAEHEALRHRSAERLELSTSEKQALLAEMEGYLADHDAFLCRQGLPPGRPGTSRLLAAAGDRSVERIRWDRLRDLAQRCRDQNQVNGGILNLSQRQVQSSLDILRGTSESVRTYDRGGETRNAQHSLSLGKA